jgi:small conductance mechanosensitive channel
MLFQLADACGANPGFVCEAVYNATESEFWAQAAEWTVERPLRLLVILVAAWLVNRLVRRAISRFIASAANRVTSDEAERAEHLHAGPLGALGDRVTAKLEALSVQRERKMQRTETLGTVLRSLATAVIYSIAVLIALGEFDINLGPFIAGAGIVGVALGFGAQTVVRDFLSGIFMLIEDQYGIGDIVDFGEATGVVEAVSLRTTRLRDVEGTVWFVPNGEIKRIGNKSQLWARAVMDIEVDYATDLGMAAEVIKRVADQVWSEALPDATIIDEPEIWGVQEFGASAIAIRLVIKTEPGEQFNAAREIRGRLKVALAEAGIDIPFPQRTVWVRQQRATGAAGSVLHAISGNDKASAAT